MLLYCIASLFVLNSGIFITSSHAEQDVLGCGGFIIADKSIDFSKINVQLLTKQGALKYETECAPHNGYFFIPIYEPGQYNLKLQPPLGWTFEKDEVSVNIGGDNDDCSNNKDIHFKFVGFGVVGRVLAAGTESTGGGPAGVNIDLLTKDEKTVVQKTVTVKDGSYVFTAVSGVDHKVRASHPTWKFQKSIGDVTLTGDNGEAEDLIVAGFDVSGRVVSGDHAMAGVNILLFGPKSAGVQCEDNSQVGGDMVSALVPGTSQLCRSTTDSKGEFLFPVVPPGKYYLVPFYQSATTRFEVAPGQKEIEVGLDSFRLQQPFKVQGFSVKGRVLTGKDGTPVDNAQVTIHGEKEHKAVTNKAGEYVVDKIATGVYKLTATKEGLEFTQRSVDISPSEPILPDILLQKVQVSGQLDFSTVGPDPERKVKITSIRDGKDSLIKINDDGSFRVMLVPSPYSISIVSSPSDTRMGNLFAPLNTDIIVKAEPIVNLYFSPVRVTIGGEVKCSGACKDLMVVLTPDAAGSEPSTQKVVNGRYSFQNQLPGRYSLAIQKSSGLCWDSPNIDFNIGSESKEDLNFSQTGWVLDIKSSHATSLKYKSKDGKDSGELEVTAGSTQLCMKTNSEYTFQSASCHQFAGENKGFKWTPGGQKLNLKADKHLVSGRVTCVETISDLQISVVDSKTDRRTIALTKPELVNGLHQYPFSFYSSPHEDISIEPQASKFLFEPVRLMISVADECSLNSAIFSATKGLFVSGEVVPALEGVTITITPTPTSPSKTLTQPMTTTTDAKGKYSVGPFARDLEYTVSAEKIGYVFTAEEDTKGNFKAKKLASIIVNIVDERKAGLGEVVVSLSGGEQNYRTNQQTGENGSISFLALAPGEYFVKPMLKEYEFLPKNKLITVTEGTEEVIQIVGKRVAVSVFGTLAGLKGDPEPGVTLEVVGEAEGCRGHQEEATSGPNGAFRIRGLKRGCEYRLGLKHFTGGSSKGHNPAAQVERTIPAMKRLVTKEDDITGIEMIALRPRTSMDVSLLVKVKKDTIKNVKAKLFCGDSHLHTLKLDTVKFVIFPSIPADGKSCWITVDANSIHVNQRVKGQRVEFLADKPFQHFTVELVVESSLAQGEIGQAGWATLPLVILLVTSILHWDKISPHAANLAAIVEQKLMLKRGAAGGKSGLQKRGGQGGGAGGDNGTDWTIISNEDLDKTVRYVEASTKKKKVKKI
eukprot:TRINITY_DN3542_c0_g1_i4.p1 TRINITY_DN3542_c0_g1~~TRINITY_DN3542_c0_g1_i4.p1  ORF type:complete len:1220 (+),score=313.21 TRINITY_DN3542_c0_g1_i4:29-3661(+)